MNSNSLLIAILLMVINVMGMQIKKIHYALEHDIMEMKPKAVALQTQFNSTDTSKFLDGLSNYVTCGGSYIGTNVGAPNVVGNPAGDVLYDLHLGSEATIVLDSCDSNFDTYIRVFDGSIEGEQVCYCDDCGPCALRTVLECTLSAGGYVVVVEGYSSSQGNIALTITCTGSDDSTPLAAGCSGLDLSETAIAHMANLSPTCEAVQFLRDASCSMPGLNQISFGSPHPFFSGGFLCKIIGDYLALGVLLDDQACDDVENLIMNPIMNGEAPDIAALVQSVLESIISRLINGVAAGVDLFANLLDSINACPVVNVHPAVWIGKIAAIIEMFETFGWIIDEAPRILENMRNGTINDCSVFSAIFTIDINIFSLAGLQKGIYVTWDFSGERDTELGMVDGVGATLDAGGPDLSIGIGATVALVIGDKGVWGEWGYTLDIGGSFPTPLGFAVGLGFGIVFTANSPTQDLQNFIGFTVSVELSVGSDSVAPDFGVSLSCGYVAAGEFGDAVSATGGCSFDIDTAITNLQDSFSRAGSALERKIDELERCVELYSCQAEQCAYGFTAEAWSECEDAAGQCRPDHGAQQCRDGFERFTCETSTLIEQEDTCAQQECRAVCGYVNWFCPFGLCDWVCDSVCDGVCLVWNYVLVPVINVVTENVPCVHGAIQTAYSCLEWIGDCVTMVGCYVQQGIDSLYQCTGGFLLPSTECLERTGFI